MVNKAQETIKRLKAEMKEQNKEIEELEKKAVEFSDKLYSVEVEVWEGGSGTGKMKVLCRYLKDAVLVKQGLEEVFPSSFGVECGNEKISRVVKVEVNAEFPHDLKDFTEAESW